jgi:hypothetical protein
MSPSDHNKACPSLLVSILAFRPPTRWLSVDHCQERKTQRRDAYRNSDRFRFPTIGPTLSGNSSRALSKKALRTHVGPRFGGTGVTYVLADGSLYLAVHAHGGWQKAAQADCSLQHLPSRRIVLVGASGLEPLTLAVSRRYSTN